MSILIAGGQMDTGMAIIAVVILGAVVFNMWFAWAVYYVSGRQ